MNFDCIHCSTVSSIHSNWCHNLHKIHVPHGLCIANTYGSFYKFLFRARFTDYLPSLKPVASLASTSPLKPTPSRSSLQVLIAIGSQTLLVRPFLQVSAVSVLQESPIHSILTALQETRVYPGAYIPLSFSLSAISERNAESSCESSKTLVKK